MLNYAKSEKRRNKRLGRKLVFIGVILLGFGFFAEIQVRPLIERSAEYMLSVAAQRIINDAIYSELSGDSYDYDSLVNVVFDNGDNGEVKSISANMLTVNRLKSRSALLINESVAALNSQDISIPLGTVSGFSILYGRGPSVPIRVEPAGYANVLFYSEFTSAGINQTLHRITMEVEADMIMLIPGFNKNISVKTDFIIAETVIVGTVPKFYAGLLAEDKQIFGGT